MRNNSPQIALVVTAVGCLVLLLAGVQLALGGCAAPEVAGTPNIPLSITPTPAQLTSSRIYISGPRLTGVEMPGACAAFTNTTPFEIPGPPSGLPRYTYDSSTLDATVSGAVTTIPGYDYQACMSVWISVNMTTTDGANALRASICQPEAVLYDGEPTQFWPPVWYAWERSDLCADVITTGDLYLEPCEVDALLYDMYPDEVGNTIYEYVNEFGCPVTGEYSTWRGWDFWKAFIYEAVSGGTPIEGTWTLVAGGAYDQGEGWVMGTLNGWGVEFCCLQEGTPTPTPAPTPTPTATPPPSGWPTGAVFHALSNGYEHTFECASMSDLQTWRDVMHWTDRIYMALGGQGLCEWNGYLYGAARNYIVRSNTGLPGSWVRVATLRESEIANWEDMGIVGFAELDSFLYLMVNTEVIQPYDKHRYPRLFRSGNGVDWNEIWEGPINSEAIGFAAAGGELFMLHWYDIYGVPLTEEHSSLYVWTGATFSPLGDCTWPPVVEFPYEHNYHTGRSLRVEDDTLYIISDGYWGPSFPQYSNDGWIDEYDPGTETCNRIETVERYDIVPLPTQAAYNNTWEEPFQGNRYSSQGTGGTSSTGKTFIFRDRTTLVHSVLGSEIGPTIGRYEVWPMNINDAVLIGWSAGGAWGWPHRTTHLFTSMDGDGWNMLMWPTSISRGWTWLVGDFLYTENFLCEEEPIPIPEPCDQYGHAAIINVDADCSGVVRFDNIKNVIPLGAEITSAELQIYGLAVEIPNEEVRVVVLNSLWGEMTCDWCRRTVGDAWAMPGAEGIPKDRAEGRIATFRTALDWITIPLPTWLVEEWARSGAANPGLLFRNPWLTGKFSFASSEFYHPTVDYTPQLVVHWMGGD